MTDPLPEPRPADTDGQREPTAQEIADELIAAVNKAMPQPPLRHNVAPPQTGSPPPVAQPGTPPMTARETQIGRVALYGGAGVSLPILSGAAFMVATEHANTAVIAWCAGGISALALLVAAFGYVVKRVVAAVPPPPPVIHNHIDGDLYQEQHEIHSHSNGLIVNSNNEQ